MSSCQLDGNMPARINSNAKGASFERKTCVRLSMWISHKTREDLFWRSAMSGGRATLRSRIGRGSAVVAQAGDISAIHELGHPFLRLFVVECKFYKDLKLESMIYGKDGHSKEIWYKTLKLADANDRAPFIVSRQNFRDELVWTTEPGLDLLRNAVLPGRELRVHVTYPVHGIHIVHLRDVLVNCDPDVLSSIASGMPECTPTKPKPRSRVSQVPVFELDDYVRPRRRRFSELGPGPTPARRRFSELETAPRRRRFSDIEAPIRTRRRPHTENAADC